MTTAPVVPAADENGVTMSPDVGALGQHDAGKWRTDQRLVVADARHAQVRLGHADLGLQRVDLRLGLVVARLGRVQRRARNEVLPREVLRALQRRLRILELGLALREVRARGLHLRGRLLPLRGDVTVLEARNDIALLDHLPFLHAEPLEPARALGGDGRTALRNHAPGRVQYRHRRRRIRGRDGGEFHRLGRAAAADQDSGDDQ